MLGWVAAVRATESPSQLRPALIQSTWIRVSSAASLPLGRRVWHRCHFPGLCEPVGVGPLSVRWGRLSATCAAMSCDYAQTAGCQAAASGSADGRVRRSAASHTTPPAPSPVVTESGSTRTPGLTDRQCAVELLQVEVDVGQQVHLVDHDQVGGGEHVRVLQRLVVALGHRDDDDLACLAEVEQRRADEVADVLDEQQRPRLGTSAASAAATMSRRGGSRRRC